MLFLGMTGFNAEWIEEDEDERNYETVQRPKVESPTEVNKQG